MSKWLFIIQGILLAIIGIIFFIYPIEALVNFTMICGIFAFVAGIISIIKAFEADRKGMFIFNGIIDILFGVTLWFSPIYSSEVLVIFFGVWGLIRGISLLCGEFQYKTAGFNIRTIYLILIIVLSILVILYPIIALAFTPIIIGVYLILIAIFEIYLCFEL
ncbi:DUF308 domain-containing protein [Clostridium sardiniense]|uniref:DUF308 domain-containing protein n=1 Tax=Clostridium sardiniense TaxID=29369 RepID=UPI00195E3AD4|nr:DUF308 domain-containing protein [Clostridium sardiniense]MBM7836368.1 uncharacterized membrane protein HdeD (DUF308 family) [Clostridium sardiniense]